jgi:hypothetical protein
MARLFRDASPPLLRDSCPEGSVLEACSAGPKKLVAPIMCTVQCTPQVTALAKNSAPHGAAPAGGGASMVPPRMIAEADMMESDGPDDVAGAAAGAARGVGRQRNGGRQRAKRDDSERKCFNCGVVGHRKRACPQPLQQASSGKRARR